MTNFEKWKQTLSPEYLIYQENAVFECDSGLCPAREFCFGLGDKMENCDKSFLLWAKTKLND